MQIPDIGMIKEESKATFRKALKIFAYINFGLAIALWGIPHSKFVLFLADIARGVVLSDLTLYGSGPAIAYHLVSWFTPILMLPIMWNVVLRGNALNDFWLQFFLCVIAFIMVYQIYVSRHVDYEGKMSLNPFEYEGLLTLMTNEYVFPIGAIVSSHIQFIWLTLTIALIQKLLKISH